MGKTKLTICILIASVIFLLIPFKPSFDFRNKLGDWALSLDAIGTASFLYESTALMGSARGQNNIAVLRFAKKRNDKELTKKNYNQAFLIASDEFLTLARGGFAAAEYNYGLLGYRCRVKRRCYQRSMRSFERAVHLGDQFAPLALGLHLSRAEKPSNQKQKIKFLKSEADKGNAYAAYKYHRLIGNSRNKKSRAEGQRYLKQAADGGIVAAMESLGMERNNPRRKYWYEEAINNGSSMAAYWLGTLYDIDEDVPERVPDFEKAAHWYERSIQNEREHERDRAAKKRLSRIIQIDSSGLRYKKIGQQLRLSSIDRPFRASYRLGVMHLSGLGVEVNRERAASAFEYAALAPIKDSGVIAAQINYRKKPEYYSPEGPFQRMGFESSKARKEWAGKPLPPQFVELMTSGSLRLMTQWDIARWRDLAKLGKLDPQIVEQLASPRILNGAWVVLSKKIDLPPAPDVWQIMPIIKTSKKQSITMPPDAYQLYSLVD